LLPDILEGPPLPSDEVVSRTPKEVREYLASIGSKGGKAGGESKVRGDADYYKRISEKAAKARKAKRTKK
jgi:hypothetical protein